MSMNRRGFFGRLAGVACLPALPLSVPAAQPEVVSGTKALFMPVTTPWNEDETVRMKASAVAANDILIRKIDRAPHKVIVRDTKGKLLAKLRKQGDSVRIVSDGQDWHIV